jgi:hypothetical protein
MSSLQKYLHFFSPIAYQKNVLSALSKFVDEDNTDDFLVLCGAAGIGKTSITSAVIGFLIKIKLYLIAAPAGRAARILGNPQKLLLA